MTALVPIWWFITEGHVDVSGFRFVLGILAAAFLGLWLSLKTSQPFPYRLNRITQEVLLTNGEQVLRIPWGEIPVRIKKSLNPRGAHCNYDLQFSFSATADGQRLWNCVGGHAPFEERSLRRWEYYCRYMESPDGQVEVRQTPEREKSASRKGWEADDESKFTQITFNLFILPFLAYPIAKAYSLNKNKHKPWPKEVQDICENHPLLREQDKAA